MLRHLEDQLLLMGVVELGVEGVAGLTGAVGHVAQPQLGHLAEHLLRGALRDLILVLVAQDQPPDAGGDGVLGEDVLLRPVVVIEEVVDAGGIGAGVQTDHNRVLRAGLIDELVLGQHLIHQTHDLIVLPGQIAVLIQIDVGHGVGADTDAHLHHIAAGLVPAVAALAGVAVVVVPALIAAGGQHTKEHQRS